MGVEVLALSLPSPASQWERLSSSNQASTRGISEIGGLEIRPSNCSIQTLSSIRASPKPTCGIQRFHCHSGIQLEAYAGSSVKKRRTATYSFGLQEPSLALKRTIEKSSLSRRALVTSKTQDVSTTLLVGEEKVGVLLLNLGGPETLEDVQPFLFNLFADPELTVVMMTSAE